MNIADLVVLRGKLVQTLLDDMIPIEVLDEDHDVLAERHNNRVNLSVVSKVSLHTLE